MHILPKTSRKDVQGVTGKAKVSKSILRPCVLNMLMLKYPAPVGVDYGNKIINHSMTTRIWLIGKVVPLLKPETPVEKDIHNL